MIEIKYKYGGIRKSRDKKLLMIKLVWLRNRSFQDTKVDLILLFVSLNDIFSNIIF